MSRALILMYHQVDTPATVQEQRFCSPPAEFRRQMLWLKQAGFRPVSLEAILAHVADGAPLPEKAVHITFDDGFVGVLEHAWPILQDLGMPATLFALPARAGEVNDWMAHRDYPRRALLSAIQLRLLADEGMTIGSHTRTHVMLSETPPADAEKEIADSKRELEDMLGREVAHFAYPFGRFNADVRNMVVRSGYRSACSTRSGFNKAGDDPFLLRRIDVSGTDRLWHFRQKLRFGTNEASRLRPLSYFAGRLAARLGQR